MRQCVVRISSVQQTTLVALYIIENRQSFQGEAIRPTPLMDLYSMINKTKSMDIYVNNFRVSCHTLCKNKLLAKYRNESLNLAFMLTDSGKVLAKELHQKLLSTL